MDCSTFAFDLHVLGTPPALILSQDQTLMLKRFVSARPARMAELKFGPTYVPDTNNPLTRVAC